MNYNAYDRGNLAPSNGSGGGAYFSSHEKEQIAAYLVEFHADLQTKYNSLPVTTDTLGKRRRKVQLEGLLDEVQHYIYMMRGTKPVKRADFPLRNSRFRDCVDAEGLFDHRSAMASADRQHGGQQSRGDNPANYVFW